MSKIDLLALCRIRDISWYFLARQAQRPGGLEELFAGAAAETGPEAKASLAAIAAEAGRLDEHREWVRGVVAAAEADGIGLTTVLDADYPPNLRLIFNLPPFLFYRGQLRPDDIRAVAVVGTRSPSEDGIRRARRIAQLLAQGGVTVLSGLARGVDTVAHESCLEAGGRTIAVLGSGLHRIYPPENGDLAERISASGAVVSQFWPDSPPRRDTFPRRNVTMSGLGQGSVVIEASASSGAKMQARFALEHGKRLFLPSSLVREREWARLYLSRSALATEIATVDDIVQLLQSREQIEAKADARLQLSLALA